MSASPAPHPYPAVVPRALIPARLSAWSWWAFFKTLFLVEATGVACGFLGGALIHLTTGKYPGLPVILAIAAGLLSWFFGWYYIARAARRGAYDVAIAQYTEAIQLNPDNALAYCGRGQVYRILAGEYAWPQMTRRICAKAVADYDEAIRLAPAEPDFHVGRVNAYHAMGRLDRAITDYTEAIRIDPSNALAYGARAVAYNALNQVDRAISDATEAIRLKPHWFLGHGARGYGFWQRGQLSRVKADYDQAIADFTEAIRLKPTDGDSYFGRAQVYRALGEHAQAAADDARVQELLGR